VGARRVGHPDAVHLDLLEIRVQSRGQLVAEVLVDVVGIHAIRHAQIGRTENCQSIGLEQARDGIEVVGRILQMFDDLEADDQVEGGVAKRQAAQVCARKVGAFSRGTRRRIGRDAIDPHDADAGAAEFPGAVA
jgi:hypothetical protein